MTEYKDCLGREIQLGDIIVSEKGHASLNTAIVIGWTPTMIRTNRGPVVPGCTMVINEQMYASGKEAEVRRLRNEYASKIENAKAPTEVAKKWRYNAFLAKEKQTGDEYIIVCRCNASSQSHMRESVQEAFDKHNMVNQSSSKVTLMFIKERWGGVKTPEWRFRDSWNYHEKGLSLRDIKSLGLEDLIDTKIHRKVFEQDYPKIGIK